MTIYEYIGVNTFLLLALAIDIFILILALRLLKYNRKYPGNTEDFFGIIKNSILWQFIKSIGIWQARDTTWQVTIVVGSLIALGIIFMIIEFTLGFFSV